MSLRDESIFLKDMLDAAKEAVSFVRDKKRDDLDQERKLALSLFRLLEIIATVCLWISHSLLL